MAVVRNPGGWPTLSQVAVLLSDPRVGLGNVTRKDVFDAACKRRLIVRESRMDSSKLADVYFELCYERGILERPQP